MVVPRPFFSETIKTGLGPKVFPWHEKFLNNFLQNVIHFSFAKFQLSLISKLADMVV